MKESRSPFRQLLKYIEDEAYDFELRINYHNLRNEKLREEFTRGYRSAINHILTQALAIYNRGLKGNDVKYMLMRDDEEETTKALLERINEKRG